MDRNRSEGKKGSKNKYSPRKKVYRNVRALSAHVLSELLKGSGSLSTGLSPHQQREDYSLLQELCFGSCRWFHQLESEISDFLQKPLRAKDYDIKCLLIVGLYQLKYLRIPDHAALNETVSAIEELNKPWARGLVNAVLRNWLRQNNNEKGDQPKPEGESNVEVGAGVETPIALARSYSHPDWLIGKLRKQYCGGASSIFRANNSRPPMTLRCNLLAAERQTLIEQFSAAEIQSRPGAYAATAIYLDSPVAVENIPGFSEGLLSVQDEASQLVPDLLECQPNDRVLDACAAPGGKTCHLLERYPSIKQLVAIDIEKQRLERVSQNLERLSLEADLVVADVSDIDSWWDGQQFDRILLDAPCSATGVIRRHPDIKLLRQADDIRKLQQQQLSILEKLWPCLSPGGLLLYTTCSILKEENSEVIESFLNHCNNAKNKPISADWGVECRYGRQLLPSDDGHDGFFFSVLCKT